MLRPTLPRTPPHAPRGRSASLTVAALRLLRWHGWTHTPERGPFLSEPATPRATASQPQQVPVRRTNPRPKKNARFASREKRRHLAILRAPRPDPASGGARFGAENQPEPWGAFTWTSEARFCCKSRRLTGSVILGEFAYRGEPSFLTCWMMGANYGIL